MSKVKFSQVAFVPGCCEENPFSCISSIQRLPAFLDLWPLQSSRLEEYVKSHLPSLIDSATCLHILPLGSYV